MKVTDIPSHGTYKHNHYDVYEWERRGDNELFIVKMAEAENPQYNVDVVFPNGMIDPNDVDNWVIGISKSYTDVETDVVSEFIDQFDKLFEHFEEKYGKVSS